MDTLKNKRMILNYLRFKYHDVRDAILREEDLIKQLVDGKLSVKDFVIERRKIFGDWEDN